MKILALCDSWEQALPFFEQLSSLKNASLSVIVLKNAKKYILPFYIRMIAKVFLRSNSKDWLKIFQLLLTKKLFICLHSLNHSKTLQWLKAQEFDIGLHKTGAIYRAECINCFKLGILNAHIGLLPEYRGRCVMEWSLLQNDSTGITTFFIDEGIDTGESIVLKEQYPVLGKFKSIAEAKNYLFQRDVEAYKKALECLCNNHPLERNVVHLGKRYYVMSELLSGCVEALLKENHISPPSYKREG